MDLAPRATPISIPKGSTKITIDFDNGTLCMDERPELIFSGLSQVEISHSRDDFRITLSKKQGS